MRITIHALIAVLSLAASQSAFDYSLQHASHPGPRRSQRSRDHHFQSYADTSRWLQSGRLTTKQLQTLVWDTKNKGEVAECCPSRIEMVAPAGGTTLNGGYVELYRDSDDQQRFYEVSCEDDVVDKPCLFVDHRLQNQSKCVQKYSFSYALVREPVERHHGGGDWEAEGAEAEGAGIGKWRMDYIKVRSGCSCEIVPRRKRAKAKRRQRDT